MRVNKLKFRYLWLSCVVDYTVEQWDCLFLVLLASEVQENCSGAKSVTDLAGQRVSFLFFLKTACGYSLVDWQSIFEKDQKAVP